MVYNKAALIGEIRKEIGASGVQCHGRSRFYNTIGMGKLIDAIIDKLEAQDLPAERVRDVMLFNLKHIPAAARGVGEDANSYLERYLSVPHYPGEFPDNPNDGSSQNPGVQGDGEADNGDNSDNDGGSESGNGTPSEPHDGDGDEDDGDGNGGGNSDGDGDEDDNDTPEPTPGPGPTPASDPVPIPPESEPEMSDGPEPEMSDGPEPEMSDEPEIQEKVRQIVRWNLAHPGEEKNILLVGPAGIGKTRLVFDISQEFFNKKPYAVTAPQMEFRICGFNDAMGREIKTPITKGYVDDGGAIILIDEIDRMDANAGIALNMATANKAMDTPNGMITQAHGVTFIATANTSGTGATNDFNTANQLDKSTRDRWVYLLMKWDHKVAMKVAKGDGALVKGMEDWNNACDKIQYTSGLVSYRTIIDVLDLLDMGVFTFNEAIEAAMLKYAIPKSNLVSIYDAMEDHYNKVAKAIKAIMEKMPDDDSIF